MTGAKQLWVLAGGNGAGKSTFYKTSLLKKRGVQFVNADMIAKLINPESIMPSFYKDAGYIRPGDAYTGKAAKELSPLLTAQEIEDVVAFLMTLKEE